MKNLRMLLCMLMGLLIGSVIGIVIANVTHSQQKKKHAQMTTTEVTATVDAEETKVPMDELQTVSDAATSADAAISEEDQPEALTAMLKRSLVSYEQLAGVDCRQLIVVDAKQEKASISMYVCGENGLWTDTGLNTEGYVGANGVSRESYEGSQMTPAGVFRIGEAFYMEAKPATGLETFQITENTYWVDDVDSELYNQRIELDGEKTWKSAEHMIDYPDAYQYGFVVDFNMNPVEAGRGSAIFFHVGDCATLGCIATSEDMVLAYLEKLSKNMHPYIVIQ